MGTEYIGSLKVQCSTDTKGQPVAAVTAPNGEGSVVTGTPTHFSGKVVNVIDGGGQTFTDITERSLQTDAGKAQLGAMVGTLGLSHCAPKPPTP
jgi:starvation-inducible outer membrane lipoprotein